MDYSGYYNVALRKVALSGRSFDEVGSEGTFQTGHVGALFSANQIRGLKSVRQIIEVRYPLRKLLFNIDKSSLETGREKF